MDSDQNLSDDNNAPQYNYYDDENWNIKSYFQNQLEKNNIKKFNIWNMK